MKRTVFNHLHEKAGAKLVDFAGFQMPVQFTGVIDEHKTVREKTGMFDVSHMGEIWIKGKGALKLIQYITTNDASILTPGHIQYTCFPNGKGGIVDDLILYHYSEDKYLLVVNASNMEKDYNWIVKNNTFDCEVENSSDAISQIALQGPKSMNVLQKLISEDLSTWENFTFKEMEVAGKNNIIVSTTGYTGAGGYELYFHNDQGEHLWEALLKAGEEFGIKPIGLAARDTLRLEMGYCLYGNDIDDTTSPLEAGLGWITKFSKENFIDKQFLQSQKEKGLTRKLIGFEMIDKGIPRHDYEIINQQGDAIGKVTSGTMSPSLGKAIGMGYVQSGYAKTGTKIFIQVRNKKLTAKVVKMPFYKG